MRVLMIVQEINEASWVRGFIVRWVRALAENVEHVYVLTLEQHAADLPENVTVMSMGKEGGRNKIREISRFYTSLVRVIRDVDVIFSHMTPRYTWLAAPLALAFRKSQMLWFTHPKPSIETRAGLFFAKWVTTATDFSFPFESPKVHPMGHGVDTELFAPRPDSQPDDPPMILAVGRLTPIKHHHILLEVAAHLRDHYPDLRARFVVVGGSAAEGDDAYKQKLLARRDELGLSADQFDLMGSMPLAELVPLTARATLVTNLTPPGSFDKAALEGMLMGKPVITPNPAFDPLLGGYRDILHVDRSDDVAGIAAAIAEVLKISPEYRQKMGESLRERTAEAHGLSSLMRRLVVLMSSS